MTASRVECPRSAAFRRSADRPRFGRTADAGGSHA
jgi:hypothetical protein